MAKNANKPILYIVVPCYKEEVVLKDTSFMFLEELTSLISKDKIHEKSRILFVNDGSPDGTWDIIKYLSSESVYFEGISLAHNKGHQNALYAGLMEAVKYADITISIDCDGQDDIGCMEKMVDEYLDGCDIVYGVRNDRKSDTFFKKFTAESFYKLMKMMGADVVFNHADYRLLSKRAVKELANYKEANLFLRGIVPLIGFKTSSVYYTRKERINGESHYNMKRMVNFAIDGITGFSVKPLRWIFKLGIVFLLISLLMLVGSFFMSSISWLYIIENSLFFFTGVILVSLGVVGEYIGKINVEVRDRPRYCIAERTDEKQGNLVDNIKKSLNM